MASIPTNSEIMVLMSRLETNWSELMNNFYDIFINPTPMYITLNLVDDNGDVQQVSIPNRAQDKEYILNGSGSPEGVVTANTGSIYQDTTNGQIYIKQTGTGNNGWYTLISKTMLDSIIQQGTGVPENTVVATKGTLYSDVLTGTLYIKQSSSGSSGWQALGSGEVSLPSVNPLNTIGDITLGGTGIYTCIPTGDINFILPTITDNTKFYQMLIEINFTTLYNINVGTTHYFNEIQPEFSANTAYTLIYEYDNIRQVWVCGLLSKG